MKILITSDVHGHLETLKKIKSKHKDIDYHLDAGDLCLDEKQYQNMYLITVKGNNDFRSSAPYERILDFEGLKILLIHGHTENVKFGLERIKLKAKLHQVDLCIFGHTHKRYLMIEDQMMFVNPGALGDEQSYAIYEHGQITFMRG